MYYRTIPWTKAFKMLPNARLEGLVFVGATKKNILLQE